MMIYTGIGKIVFNDNEYETFIELNPEDGELLASIPQSRDLINVLIGDNEIFKNNYFITDFSCNLPNGKISSKSIDHLLLQKISPGTFSINDSMSFS